MRPQRAFSLGQKMSSGVVLVLALAAIWASLTLVQRARAELFEAKRVGASMVARLFAASVVAPLDFDDQEALNTKLGELHSNEQVVYAAIWPSEASAPAAEFQRTAQTRTRPERTGTRFSAETLELTEPVIGQDERRLGTVVLRFTLLPEIARYEAMRRRILAFSALLTGVVAALLLGMARWHIVGPLERLSRAARDLEHGRETRLPTRAADEIGQLFAVFNDMSQAIADRELRLRELNSRLQELLDHMRQAIIVLNADGTLLEVRSREAQNLFELDRNWSKPLGELLYANRSDSVEREALDAWLGASFGSSSEDWDELNALAPSAAVLNPGQDSERNLLLEFRPLWSNGVVNKIMLLATDETEKYHLRQTVERKEQEHRQQVAALRRFVSGGELLISALRRATERTAECKARLEETSPSIDRETIDVVFEHAHTMKGEARSLDLALLEAAAAALEDSLAIARTRMQGGALPLRAELAPSLLLRVAEISRQVREAETVIAEASPLGEEVFEQVTVSRRDLAELKRLMPPNDEIRHVLRRLTARPFGESLSALVDGAPRWANARKKRARVEVEGKEVKVPSELANLLPGVLAHLVRNAVAHGIELPEQRLAAEKPEIGLITLSCSGDATHVRIEVSDDGSGIDDVALSKRADEAGLSGLEVEDLAFAAGLSTQRTADDLAGRGVGLSAVRRELSLVGFATRIRSVAGRGTTVVIESASRVAS